MAAPLDEYEKEAGCVPILHPEDSGIALSPPEPWSRSELGPCVASEFSSHGNLIAHILRALYCHNTFEKLEDLTPYS
ncbi:UNVERIFIED_CONTAM: hypothetical protein K2H54_070381 [Gekko kuhli]